MADILSKAERSSIRHALSDAFVDNEVDYTDIAKRVKDFDYNTVEQIFFHEVAPVCHSNLETPVPPIWTGFDKEWLDQEIEKLQKASAQGYFKRLKQDILIATLKWKYTTTWKAIKDAV